MSTFDSAIRSSLTALFLLYAVSSWAQAPSARFVERFQRITYAAFPELHGQPLTATFTSKVAFDRDWHVILPGVELTVTRRGQFDSRGYEIVEPDSLILTGDYSIRAGDNETAFFRGPHVNSSQIAELMEEANRHPEWRLDDLDQALKSRGAKVSVLTPAIFLKTFAVERFAPLVGRIRNASARFSWRPRVPNTNVEDLVLPTWIVTFEGDDGSGPKCYFLNAEPIDGRLQRLAQRDCQ